jgi:hypothetical protein
MASNADYALQFSLRVSGWRMSPAASLSSWSLGRYEEISISVDSFGAAT